MTVSVESRVRGALWGLFAGDALAMPSHWYYGGKRQVQQDYGRSGITGYVQPVERLPGSIMSKSNTDGAGRGSFNAGRPSIIGDYINHGKKKYWAPNQSYHYHATLKAGENTLEAQLVRVLMRSVVRSGGSFEPSAFREDYVEFMTREGSHNDTYASTCHRMFFANMIHGGLDPEDCPDNDRHNVDTIDGLVLPTVSILAAALRGGGGGVGAEAQETARQASAATAAVTRKSAALEAHARVWSDLLFDTVQGATSLLDALNVTAESLRLPPPSQTSADAIVS